MKTRVFWNRPGNRADFLESHGDFADSAGEGRMQALQGTAMVDGAERFQEAGGSDGHQRIALAILGGVHQAAQKSGGNARHVASDYQVPVRPGLLQRGENAAQRAFPGINVRHNGVAKECVTAGASDDAHSFRSRLHGIRHNLPKRGAAVGQQGLVPTHPGTASPHQHIPRPAAHTEMIPSDKQGKVRVLPLGNRRGMSYTEVPNILRRFCFRLGLGLVFGAGLFAADQVDRPEQVVRVVRADPRTGKLVRSVIVTAKPGAARKAGGTAVAPRGIDEAVAAIAFTQSLPPQLVHSVIQVESNYDPLAISSKGAQGLMQLMPATARRFGVANAFDPVDNIQGGARYLKYLLDLYKGDYSLALAAYNAGEGAVQKYGAVPPYPETLNYLAQVGRQLQKRSSVAPPPETPPAAPKTAEAQPAGPAHIQEVVGPDGSIRYISR